MATRFVSPSWPLFRDPVPPSSSLLQSRAVSPVLRVPFVTVTPTRLITRTDSACVEMRCVRRARDGLGATSSVGAFAIGVGPGHRADASTTQQARSHVRLQKRLG